MGLLALLLPPFSQACLSEGGLPGGPGSRGDAPGGEAILLPTDATTLWAGRTQVLTFRVEAPAEAQRELRAVVADPGLVELVTPARVLPGRTEGTLRLRALAAGETRLELGGRSMTLTVRESADPEAPGVRLVSPVAGALGWGRVAIGIEVTPGATDALPPDAVVALSLAPGGWRERAHQVPGDFGRARRFVYELDLDALPAGPLSVTAVLRGSHRTLAESEPVHLAVVRPEESELFAAECEELDDVERPPAYGPDPPRTGSAADASGGGFVVCYGPNPSLVARVEVERSGRFQLAARARGDFAAGAFPSLALCVDHPTRARASGRIVDTRWRRHLIGAPVELEAGEHELVLRYPNEAAVPRSADRNLYLDSFELLRAEGDAAREVLVAFERPLDGLAVNGRFELRGVCRWSDPNGARAPRVQLVVDDVPVAAQRSALPLFALDPAALGAGWHRVRLVATLDDGARHETPDQRIHVPFELPADAARRATRAFSVADEGWGAALSGLLRSDGELPGHHHARLGAGDVIELALPDELAGEQRVILHARGPDYPWAALARVELVTSAGVVPVGEAESWGYWSFRDGGVARLEPGPKALRLTFDGFREKRATDGKHRARGLWLRDVVLKEERSAPDRVAPRVALIHPAPLEELFGSDALVAEALDDDRLVSAELLIDGRPSGVFARPPDGLGPIVIPFTLRELEPGEHALALRVADAAGNQGQSEEHVVRVHGSAPLEPGRHARALRLLERFAYGPEEAELAAVLTLGERDWLEDRLAPFGAREQAALDVTRAYQRDLGAAQVRVAALRHALRTTNPVRARFVLWLDDHFSTWLSKAGAEAEWRDHLAFQRLGAAPFVDCLWASVTSPAMLWFLDQQRSYAGALNENYARELLELHTLGLEGGYTQADVTALAGVLAGLTVSEEAGLGGRGGITREFRYDPALGDRAPHEVLGLRFDEPAGAPRFDRVRRVVELVSMHPGTARHIARKLAEHYVAVPAPAELVDELARVFLESGGDLRALLLAIPFAPAFHDPALPARVCTPLEYGLRFVRAGGAYQLDSALSDYLSRSGMGVFDRATPDGWPEGDDAWVDTNVTMQRWRLPADYRWPLVRLVPPQQRARPVGDASGWHQRLVDALALRLCGRALDASSNAAALAMLAELEVPNQELVERAAIFVARTPEASLR